jgi:hypothetical protein
MNTDGLKPNRCGNLHERDVSSEFGRVGATECQLTIRDRCRICRFKVYGDNIRCDGSLAEEVIRDCRDIVTPGWQQGADRQVRGANTTVSSVRVN